MKNKILAVLQVLGMLFIFWWIFQDLNWFQVRDLYKRADPAWLLGGTGILILSLVLGAVQWFVLLRGQEIPISFLYTLKIYWIALFFSNVLPGSIAGDFVRIYSLARYQNQGKRGFAATVIDRFAGLFALVIFSLAAAAYLLLFHREELSRSSLYLASTILFIFCIFVVMFFVLFSQRTFRIIFDVILGSLQDILLVQKIRDLHTHFHVFRKMPRLLLKVGGLSMLIQFLRIMVHYCAACALGVPPSALLFFLLIVPLIALAAILPVSPGGVGIREKVGKDIFPKVGIAMDAAFSFEFLATLLGLFTSLPGALFFLLERRRRSEQD